MEDREIVEAYENVTKGEEGLEVRGLREALRRVNITASATEAIQMHQKYNTSGSGRLSLDEFTQLVTEFKAFESASREDGGGENPQSRQPTSSYGQARATTTTRQPSGVPVESPPVAEEPYSGPPMPEPLSESEAARLAPPPMPDVLPPEQPPANMPLPFVPHSSAGGGGNTSRNDRRVSDDLRRSRDGKAGGADRVRSRSPSRQVFGGGGGGVFLPPDDVVGTSSRDLRGYEHAGLGSGEDAHILRLLADYAGGKTLHPSQHWVVRAMRALELRYQAAAREEGVQRFNLEVHANQLAHDLGAHQRALREAEESRRTAGADAERARDALVQEQQLNQALKEHNAGLLKERDMLVADLERAQGQLKSHKREIQTLQARWQQAANEAGEWAQRAYEAQTETRAALAEANEARAAAASVERSMLTAQEYRLSEEAGYQMQTIIQMAPSRATVTSVYEQPQTIDTYVPM